MHRTHDWLQEQADTNCAYITTIGRRTGKQHRIEIWFGAAEGRVYLLADSGTQSDWVSNLLVNPQVTVEIGDGRHNGTARAIDPQAADDSFARELVVQKYLTKHPHRCDDFRIWRDRSLPIVITFP